MVKVARTETAIVGPIMAAVLSGLPGMVVGVGVTITDPGARVDSCTPGVNANPSPKSCGGVVIIGEGKVLQGKGFWFHCISCGVAI